MAYDIYGNYLRPGHCEVHPEVPELFPCYRCIEEGREREYVSEPPEPTAEDYCVTVDKIMYDALLAALPVLWGLVQEKGLHPEQKGYLCEGYAAYQQVKEALEKAEGRERP